MCCSTERWIWRSSENGHSARLSAFGRVKCRSSSSSRFSSKCRGRRMVKAQVVVRRREHV